jgi:hypothetical protein
LYATNPGDFGVLPITTVLFAFQNGDSYAVERFAGAKFTGAPSRQRAGRMEVIDERLEDAFNKSFFGKVSNPQPLVNLGLKDIAPCDRIELRQTETDTWEVKLLKPNKTIRLKVVFWRYAAEVAGCGMA